MSERNESSLLKLYKETVLAFAKTINAKTPYMWGHSERVAKYSTMIAKRAGDDKQAIEEVYLAGLLHDIGKTAIPNDILNKPDKLTENEYKIVKNHTERGFELLSNIHEDNRFAICARSHHERFDGHGYPDGLSGPKINRTARIIAVADAYDAMTSLRSYRGIMSQQSAKAEIKNGIGKQFDPVFGGIMLQLIEEDKDFSMKQGTF